jgi:hypothetical protein
MIMKDKTATFLKVFLVFFIPVLVLNLTGELTISPENKIRIAENGWAEFIQEQVVGVVVLYILTGLIGTIVFLRTRLKWVVLGSLSLAIGAVLEFAFMRPQWVQDVFALHMDAGVMIAVVISALYWFIIWGLPAFLLAKVKFLRPLSENR